MRVGVTGAGGLLGSTLVPLWRSAGADVTGWSRHALDVTDGAAVEAALAALRPEVVVHAAAWTDVDGAEARPDEAMRVNQGGAAHIAAACARTGARLVHISSDYVFDAAPGVPVGIDEPLRPLGAYARSKAAAEAAVRAASPRGLIVRTGWVYGPLGRNFIDTMRGAASQRRAVRVVDDQTGAPTSARLIAEAVWGLLRGGAEGTWHVAAAGQASWCEVARSVFAASGAPVALVTPCSTAEMARPAPRPAWSVLDCRAVEARLGAALPHWEGQVRRYVQTSQLEPCGLLATA